MITEITKPFYQTEDGSLFDTREEAERHELVNDLLEHAYLGINEVETAVRCISGVRIDSKREKV